MVRLQVHFYGFAQTLQQMQMFHNGCGVMVKIDLTASFAGGFVLGEKSIPFDLRMFV